jgi:pimeloyl-ACP methyl ester carboxylesterase
MTEQAVEVNGGVVVYELIGPRDGEVVVLTPGGRFSKDYGGVHELAYALADGGKRVLLWDRPNCGKSDIQLYGKSESHMRAETLGLMLKELGIEKVVAAGGSGGARDSLAFTLMWPDLVSKLAMWCIVGGNFGTLVLAQVYVMGELRAVRANGIEGVMEMSEGPGSWAQLIEANPRNKDRLLATGAEEFERVMNRWLDSYMPKPNEPMPGIADWEFEQVKVPTLIIRGGERDYDHPKRTSLEVHALIRGSRLIEPPWAEDAWEAAGRAVAAEEGSLFDFWVQGAPALLSFINEP